MSNTSVLCQQGSPQCRVEISPNAEASPPANDYSKEVETLLPCLYYSGAD